MEDFKLYPYQEDAKNIVDNTENNLIVSAGTGVGKSMVIEFSIEKAIRDNKEILITFPIKALSLQKYHEYKAKYHDVGIMTGDITIKRNARIMIMTTEILKNMLVKQDYTMFENANAVIIDESHYLGDSGRGCVFEELMYRMPKDVRMVLLSATIANADQITAWLKTVHKETQLIKTDFIPVEKKHYYYTNASLREIDELKVIPKPIGEYDLNKFVRKLNKDFMLPAIYFVFNRDKCLELAQEIQVSLLDTQEKKEIRLLIAEFEQTYPNFRHNEYHCLKKLLLNGVAIHHAGLLPEIKNFIERTYLKKLIKVVFATESLACGINLPCKTTILSSINKWSDEGNRFLTIAEARQMSGRAGRKGFDDFGYVIILGDDKHEDLLIKSYIFSESEKIESSMNIQYNTISNAIDSFGVEDFKKSLSKTFLSFTSTSKDHNFCSKYTDYRFKKFLNYTLMLTKLEDKFKNGILDSKEYKRKQSSIKKSLTNYACSACKQIGIHVQHLKDKNECKTVNKLIIEVDDTLRILRHYKHLDKNNTLTWSGKLLRDINAENELFILELLLSGLFDDLHYDQIACVLATVLAGNKKRDISKYDKKKLDIKLALTQCRNILTTLKSVESINNKDNNLDLNTCYNNLVDEFVNGATWQDLYSKGLRFSYEGEFFRLLRQIINILKQFSKIDDDGIVSEKLKYEIRLAIENLDRDEVKDLV